jgi:outer membrane receptor protein involved in Fe transport
LFKPNLGPHWSKVVKKKSIRIIGGLALAITATIAATSAQAAAVLEEIIVTAQKRTQSLQDVPISITTLDGVRIQQAAINTVNELAAYIPNLMLTENAVATSIIIRGIGPGANQSFEQSVGLFLDGVHLAKGRQARSGLFDLERVEVLRGPQGILFGKNTLAGAVNVTSATPVVGDPFGGRITLGIESHDGQLIEGDIYGSIGDTLALRFAFKDRQDDGYLDNTLLGTKVPSTDETLMRFAATWQPTDNTTIKFKHTEGEYTRGGGTTVIQSFDPAPNLAASNALLFGVMALFHPQIQANVDAGIFTDIYRDSVSFGGLVLAQSLGQSLNQTDEKQEGTDTENHDTSLNIDIDFGAGYTFTSVTGLAKYEYEDGLDADFLPVTFVSRSDISEYEQISQEFRIASDPSERFSFISGLYWEDTTQEIDRIVGFDGTLGLPAPVMTAIIGSPSFLTIPREVTDALGLPFAVDGFTSFNQFGRLSNWRQDSDAWAVFFQGAYQITDTLTVTAGLRYTEEDKKVTAVMDLTASATGLAVINTNPFLASLAAASFASYAHDFSGKRSTDQLMPAIGLEWRQSDDNLYYASYSEGFKSGGFNAVDDQLPDFVLNPLPPFTIAGTGFEYEDETAESFEIGGKHTLLDGAMTFNWAVFTSDYDNQQVSTFVGLAFVVANAASSEVDGIELDLQWQATENLRLSANVAYLDARYGSFPSAACTIIQTGLLRPATAAGETASVGRCTTTPGATGTPSVTQDLKGVTLTHAPKYSGALYADYVRDMSNGWQWFLGADLNFTDGYFLSGDADPLDFQDSFAKINLRGGLRSDHWELIVYGKNVTDEITLSGGFDIPLAAGAHGGYTDAGEIYGARVTYRF